MKKFFILTVLSLFAFIHSYGQCPSSTSGACGGGGWQWTYTLQAGGTISFGSMMNPAGTWFYVNGSPVAANQVIAGPGTFTILAIDPQPAVADLLDNLSGCVNGTCAASSWTVAQPACAPVEVSLGGHDCLYDSCIDCGTPPPSDCDPDVAGVQSPGDSCNDMDPDTGNDVYQSDCTCMGEVIDCSGIPGGTALPNTSCDDGIATTSNDTWNANCLCVGTPDCDAGIAGIQNPGDSCNDNNVNTPASFYNASCTCQGDCDLTVSGFQSPGNACNDGDPNTVNDVYTTACVCAGIADCNLAELGIQNPGDPCDDGDANTGLDFYNENCDCIGYCSYGFAGNFVIGDPCNDGNANTLNDTYNTQCVCAGTSISTGVDVHIKLFLEGPYHPETGLMNALLSSSISLQQPYNVDPYFYAGNESISSLPAGISDWIYIQLRATDMNTVVGERAAFLREDGIVVDTDFSTGVYFDNVSNGNYFITVYHRAHLGVISASAIELPNISPYDFTTAVSQSYGVGQLKLIDVAANKYGLFCGDYDGSGVINNLDYNAWYSNNTGVNQYLPWDGNISSVVNNLDYNLWYANRSKVGVSFIQLP